MVFVFPGHPRRATRNSHKRNAASCRDLRSSLLSEHAKAPIGPIRSNTSARSDRDMSSTRYRKPRPSSLAGEGVVVQPQSPAPPPARADEKGPAAPVGEPDVLEGDGENLAVGEFDDRFSRRSRAWTKREKANRRSPAACAKRKS